MICFEGIASSGDNSQEAASSISRRSYVRMSREEYGELFREKSSFSTQEKDFLLTNLDRIAPNQRRSFFECVERIVEEISKKWEVMTPEVNSVVYYLARHPVEDWKEVTTFTVKSGRHTGAYEADDGFEDDEENPNLIVSDFTRALSWDRIKRREYMSFVGTHCIGDSDDILEAIKECKTQVSPVVVDQIAAATRVALKNPINKKARGESIADFIKQKLAEIRARNWEGEIVL